MGCWRISTCTSTPHFHDGGKTHEVDHDRNFDRVRPRRLGRHLVVARSHRLGRCLRLPDRWDNDGSIPSRDRARRANPCRLARQEAMTSAGRVGIGHSPRAPNPQSHDCGFFIPEMSERDESRNFHLRANEGTSNILFQKFQNLRMQCRIGNHNIASTTLPRIAFTISH